MMKSRSSPELSSGGVKWWGSELSSGVTPNSVRGGVRTQFTPSRRANGARAFIKHLFKTSGNSIRHMTLVNSWHRARAVLSRREDRKGPPSPKGSVGLF